MKYVSNNIIVSVILAGIFFVIAIFCGLFTATDYDSLTAIADDGVITSIDKTTSRRRGRTTTKYRAIVSFTDSDHRSHKARSIVNTKSSARYKVGMKVSVRYDPWNPDDGCLIVGDEDLVEGNLFMTIFLMIASGVCLVMAVVGLLVKRHKEQKA